MTKVSVIIPVYNAEKYLTKCLESVCQQTLADIEIICINDCSADNSLGILQEYAEHDSRIKVIDFKENKGAAAARNTGIEAAAGEYTGFVDSDDYVDLDFYKKLYEKAIESGAEAVKGKIRIHSDTFNLEREIFYDNNDDIKVNKAYFYHSFTSAIYKTDFIKKNKIYFPVGINNFEDPYFSITAGFYYKKLALVSNAYYHYVDRIESSSKIINTDILSGILLSMEKIYHSLNKASIDVTHYVIVYDFLLNFLKPLTFNKVFSTPINCKLLDLYASMILNCKYKEEAMQYYFYKREKDQKAFEKKKTLMDLKNNFVKKTI